MPKKRDQKKPKPTAEERVGKLRDEKAARRAADTRAMNDLVKIPPVKDPARRAKAEGSLRYFLETYFPGVFPLAWSPDHLEIIAKVEQSLRDGTFFAMAMPRGSGKSSITQRAAVWAVLCGHVRFTMVVCADVGKAQQAIRSIKKELESNLLLSHDFPEVCYPIRALGGSTHKVKGQHLNGVRTEMLWNADEIVLPTIHIDGQKTKASGGILRTAGITGAARGAQFTREGEDGHVTEVIRPELILVDDFLTREASASPTQSANRLQIVSADLGAMAAPGKKISMLATMTVIHQGDAADQLLDRTLHPEFHGVRKKLVNKWSDNAELWDEWGILYTAEMRNDESHDASTQFVKDNFEEMHRGSEVPWEQRKSPSDVSALHHAHILKLTCKEEAFASEYQNEPLAEQENELDFLDAQQIAAKVNGLKPSEIPIEVEKITCGIDVQGNSLWWVIVGWGAGYVGYVLDYGVFPDQGRRRFTQRELPKTLAATYPGLNEEEAIFEAIVDLHGELNSRTWTRADGAELTLSRIMIDSGFQTSTVHLACRKLKTYGNIMPCKGMGIGAGRPPMSEWPKKKGERAGDGWRIRLADANRSIRHCLIDANLWKTFIAQRWQTPLGGKGSLSLWGNDTARHTMFSEHQTNEFYSLTFGHGRQVVEWRLLPAKPDQHWLDAIAYAAVAADEQGIRLLDKEDKPPQKKKRKTLAELRRAAG